MSDDELNRCCCCYYCSIIVIVFPISGVPAAGGACGEGEAGARGAGEAGEGDIRADEEGSGTVGIR